VFGLASAVVCPSSWAASPTVPPLEQLVKSTVAMTNAAVCRTCFATSLPVRRRALAPGWSIGPQLGRGEHIAVCRYSVTVRGGRPDADTRSDPLRQSDLVIPFWCRPWKHMPSRLGEERRLTGLRATGEQDVQTRSDRALQKAGGPPTGT